MIMNREQEAIYSALKDYVLRTWNDYCLFHGRKYAEAYEHATIALEAYMRSIGAEEHIAA